MMNKVLLEGRPTKDPVYEITELGKNRVTIFLACKGYNKNQDADFFKCIGWGKTAERVRDYVIMGLLISVEGQLRSYTYDDPTTGQHRYETYVKIDHVNFLESKEDRQKKNAERELVPCNLQESDNLDPDSKDK